MELWNYGIVGLWNSGIVELDGLQNWMDWYDCGIIEFMNYVIAGLRKCGKIYV